MITTIIVKYPIVLWCQAILLFTVLSIKCHIPVCSWEHARFRIACKRLWNLITVQYVPAVLVNTSILICVKIETFTFSSVIKIHISSCCNTIKKAINRSSLLKVGLISLLTRYIYRPCWQWGNKITCIRIVNHHKHPKGTIKRIDKVYDIVLISWNSAQIEYVKYLFVIGGIFLNLL